jgi:hypothetical protein
MDTATWAILVSFVSLLVATASFVWSVWATFIHPKAKVSVTAGFCFVDPVTRTIVSTTGYHDPPEMASKDNWEKPAVYFEATNHGPGKVTLRVAVGTKNWIARANKSKLGTIYPYYDYPFDLSTKGIVAKELPRTIDVGEDVRVYCPPTVDWFTKDKLKRFGFVDSFGRVHLCSRRNGKALNHNVTSRVAGAS